MSTNILEKVLWDLSVNRDAKQRFKDDPSKLLSRYHLTDVEREMVQNFDVRGLADAGVNTMLTQGFWLELEESHAIEGYLRRMNERPLSKAEGAKRD